MLKCQQTENRTRYLIITAYQLHFAKRTPTDDFYHIKIVGVHTTLFNKFTRLFVWKGIKSTSGFELEKPLKVNKATVNLQTHIFEGSFRRSCFFSGLESHNHSLTTECRPNEQVSRELMNTLCCLIAWQLERDIYSLTKSPSI